MTTCFTDALLGEEDGCDENNILTLVRKLFTGLPLGQTRVSLPRTKQGTSQELDALYRNLALI
jgi:hypothetical protein